MCIKRANISHSSFNWDFIRQLHSLFFFSFSFRDLNKRAHFISNSLQRFFFDANMLTRFTTEERFFRLFGSQFPVFLFRVQTLKFVVDAKQICNAFPTFINILPFHSWVSRLLFGNVVCAGWIWFLCFLLLYSCLEFQCSWSICSSFPYTIWLFFVQPLLLPNTHFNIKSERNGEKREREKRRWVENELVSSSSYWMLNQMSIFMIMAGSEKRMSWKTKILLTDRVSCIHSYRMEKCAEEWSILLVFVYSVGKFNGKKNQTKPNRKKMEILKMSQKNKQTNKSKWTRWISCFPWCVFHQLSFCARLHWTKAMCWTVLSRGAHTHTHTNMLGCIVLCNAS